MSLRFLTELARRWMAAQLRLTVDETWDAQLARLNAAQKAALRAARLTRADALLTRYGPRRAHGRARSPQRRGGDAAHDVSLRVLVGALRRHQPDGDREAYLRWCRVLLGSDDLDALGARDSEAHRRAQEALARRTREARAGRE